MRVSDCLLEGSAYLRAVTDAPRTEAELLLSHAMDVPRVTLLAYPERRVAVDQGALYWHLIDRRRENYPLPYLVGRAPFYGLDIAVTPDVLIPRPETELLVDLALARAPRLVLDVGTGSGCVAVALAAHLPAARVYATDVSAAALRVAQANARRHGVHERVCLVQADLARPFKGLADVLVSNPPYVAESEWASLPDSVRVHEPRLALWGGADGLDVVRRLVRAAPEVLRPGGSMFVEIGAAQGMDAVRLARAALPAAEVLLHVDWAGRDRVLEVAFPETVR
ncbi:MAG: peptide chain release factor N(5)-glutamine methyltransferase [Anaerolineae bacterium]|nr:peptide chain release factor N(5)-glutamine methyltransferase [Anaerolineae bacterium]